MEEHINEIARLGSSGGRENSVNENIIIVVDVNAGLCFDRWLNILHSSDTAEEFLLKPGGHVSSSRPIQFG